MKIITRKEAKKQNLKFYFTGKFCKHKHVCERYISDYQCIECVKVYNEANKEKLVKQKKEYRVVHKKDHKIYRALHKEEKVEYDKIYRGANKEKLAKQNKIYRGANKEKLAKQKKDYYEANKKQIAKKAKKYHEANKEKLAKQKKEYRKNNQDKFAALSAKRNANKNQAIPCWYNFEKGEIEAIYKSCREKTKFTGITYHVDHIYPLQCEEITIKAGDNCTDEDWTGRKVCGLHTIINLDVITQFKNLKKSNKFIEIAWRKKCEDHE